MKIVNVLVPTVLILWSAVVQLHVSAFNFENFYITNGYLQSLANQYEQCQLPQGSYLCLEIDRVKITCEFRNSSSSSNSTYMSGLDLEFSDGELWSKFFHTRDGSIMDSIFLFDSAKRIPTSSGKPWLDITDSRTLSEPFVNSITDFVSKSWININAYIADPSDEIFYALNVKLYFKFIFFFTK